MSERNDSLAVAIAEALSCPTPRKTRFEEKTSALAVVQEMGVRGLRARAFFCRGCGSWHVTTKRNRRLMEARS